MINFMSPLELEKLVKKWDPDGTGILGVYTGMAFRLAMNFTENSHHMLAGESIVAELELGPTGQSELNKEMKAIDSVESGAEYFQRAWRDIFADLEQSGWEISDIKVSEDGWSVRFSIKCGEIYQRTDKYIISTYSNNVQ